MRETSRQKSLTMTGSDESVRVIKELLTISCTFVMCFEEKTEWYVRLLDERCSGRPGESTETQEDRTRTVAIPFSDGKSGLHSGPGETKWILYTSE